MKVSTISAAVTEIIDPEEFAGTGVDFGIAKKTKCILVKPMQSLLTDERVMPKFLLATLEGTQMLKANSMVCVSMGADGQPLGDIWQQDEEKLHKQYDPVHVFSDGWVRFKPKPEAEREYTQIHIGYIDSENSLPFSIRAQWGEHQSDGTYLQHGKSGDYILRSADSDHGVDENGQQDIWIVAKEVFEATYEVQ